MDPMRDRVAEHERRIAALERAVKALESAPADNDDEKPKKKK